jgi:hypothetical protein
MSGSKVNHAHILEGTFRANPDYELVLFDRLPEEQRTLLADLQKDPQFYGVLRPRPGAELGTKSVCRETALLFSTLSQAGRIPRYVIRESGAQSNVTVADLVLDGVLALEHAGEWVTGAGAFALFGPAPSSAPDPSNVLMRLSWDALEYAAHLTVNDASALAMRLYNYNSLPLSPARLATLTSSEALERSHPPPLAEWAAVPAAPQTEGWSAWRSRRSESRRAGGGSNFKLYVSPMPDALPEAFKTVVAAAGDWGALQFKTGRRGHDLLRPDKLVVYFPGMPSLEGAAEQIRRALAGCPSQGVPFTAEVNGAGESGSALLSWGFDPPADPAAPEWLRRESWRLKLANRLGVSLAMAKQNPAEGVSPVDFALARLRSEGVDTETWSPMSDLQEVRS